VTQRHVVQFAETAVAVDSGDASAWAVVQFALGDLADGGDRIPAATFTVKPAGTTGTYALLEGDRVLNAQDSPGAVAVHLACEVARIVAERDRSGMLLHAAAVAWGRCGILMPGHSGAGKTTLTAHLLRHGCEYVTDELVCVPSGASRMTGLARPLSLKPGAWSSFHTLLAGENNRADVMNTRDGWLMRPRCLNSAVAKDAPSLNLMVFPRRAPGGPARLRRLSKGEAALALLANLVNARNLEGDGIGYVAQLALAVPAWEACYDNAESIIVEIGRAVDQNCLRSTTG